MRYFHISTGLRGCYMPDESYTAACDTRRDLRRIVEGEAERMREGYKFGGSKRSVATFVAECWRAAAKDKAGQLPYCLPFGDKPSARPFGVFVSKATRGEYQEFLKSIGEECP